jgi:hypothetical protein
MRAYSKGDLVEARKNLGVPGGTIREGTEGVVVHDSDAQTPTVDVKFDGDPLSFRIVAKSDVRPST